MVFFAFHGGSDTRSSSPSPAFHRWPFAFLILITIALSLFDGTRVRKSVYSAFHPNADKKFSPCFTWKMEGGGVVAFTGEGEGSAFK